MMHYADSLAAGGYPAYEMLPHPGYMPHLYPGQYSAMAAAAGAAEPPPSLYTSTPGPTTGGTLVRPRAVHAKPDYAVPAAEALVSYIPGAFQPYHAMGYRYHLDPTMLHSHYAGMGMPEAGDDDDGEGDANGADEVQLRSKWRDMVGAGRYPPGAGGSAAQEEIMMHHMAAAGPPAPHEGAAAIVAAAAVAAQQRQEQEQDDRRR